MTSSAAVCSHHLLIPMRRCDPSRKTRTLLESCYPSPGLVAFLLRLPADKRPSSTIAGLAIATSLSGQDQAELHPREVVRDVKRTAVVATRGKKTSARTSML